MVLSVDLFVRSGEFANCGLFVVAGNVMPFDTIGIEVIEDSDANFIAVTVVRLGFRSGLLSAKNRTKTPHELFKQIMCNNSIGVFDFVL